MKLLKLLLLSKVTVVLPVVEFLDFYLLLA